MTNNPTIDGVSRELVECDACPTSGGCVKTCMKAAPVVEADGIAEPVAYRCFDGEGNFDYWDDSKETGGNWNFATENLYSADQLAALQSTIAQLQGRIAELESARGEPVAWQYRVSAGPATGWSLWHDGKGDEFRNSYQVENRPLFTAPPAPVEVVLPERMPKYHALKHPAYMQGWNACIDATAALNGERK